MTLFRAENLTKRFGGLVANDNISLSVEEGEIVGLIGPNGAGKSTFFSVVSGFYRPDAGRVYFKGEDITGLPPEKVCLKGLARTFQIVKPFGDMTVLENVMTGAFARSTRVSEVRERAEEVLELAGLSARAHQSAGSLTIADKKRLELARALATQPSLLMLDEVMAGLTPVETQQAVDLIRKIHATGVTIFIVEHVMEVIMPISDRVFVLDGGKKIAEGLPEEIINNEEVIKAYLGVKYHAARGQ